MRDHLGFIGVGRMGGPMALRLIDAGHRLTIYDTSTAALAPLAARGADVAKSTREVAAAAETVLVSLPTPDIVRAVALGENGIAAGGRVKTFVDLSTTGPRVAAEIAEGLEKKGIAAVDSPVSGGVGGAVKGTLAVMAACPHALFVRLEPILRVFGKPFYIGDKPGMGQTMKLANNLLSATAMAISCEAIVMGVKAGLDPQTMLDVINAGSGRNTATQDKFPKAILTRSFDYGF
ncbi:MAG TPA: NAD(P)-dependent oxidoreductase, partial [Stellaceae bacterium]|nr:NAD(P)-dependent oxidoreductase [Stellaceae bacterium]